MSIKRPAGIAGLITLALAAAAAPAQAVTFPVINNSNSGAGSLRSAINAANQTAAPDEIEFAIQGAGPHTITLANDLPTISQPLVIRGYTETGATPATATTAADIQIVLNAANALRGLEITSDGVEVRGLAIRSAQETGIFVESSHNIIAGNHIGTNRAGTVAQPNGVDGVRVHNTGNTIGGPDDADRNVIVGGATGVRIDSGTQHVIEGNRIGTNADGDTALGAGEGVVVESDNNTVRDNLLSGQDTGARIEGDDNVVQGNRAGTDLDGTASLANDWGVIVSGGDNNLIGGTADGQGNLLSGNTHAGLRLEAGDDAAATLNLVQGNLVGTDVNGDSQLPNGNNGVAIDASNANTLGGTEDGARNVISGNGGDGVNIKEPGADDNVLHGNLIGTDIGGTHELGNSGNGVYIEDGNGNEIGDPLTAFAQNTIAYNDENGVGVAAGVGNSILRNSIHRNGDLGIDLEIDGVTANDFFDVDAGANNLQNFARVTSATAGAVTSVNWSMSGQPNTDFRLEFYASDSCDASGNGEGQTYLGTQIVTTSMFGNVADRADLGALSTAGQEITMTATGNGSTSEFSSCVESS